MVWSAARIVATVALFGLVLLALTGPSRLADDSWALYYFALVAAVAALVATLTNRAAMAQSAALRMWAGTATVVIQRAPAEVWAFVRRADTAPLVQPTVRRGFKVPGTPDGPGEQQAFIHAEPSGTLAAQVVEVVDEQPGVSTVVRNVTGAPVHQQYDLAAVPGGGTTLTCTIELSGLRWTPYRVHPRRQAAAAAEAYVNAVKAVIESQPPPFGPSGALPMAPPPTPPQPAVPPPYRPPVTRSGR